MNARSSQVTLLRKILVTLLIGAVAYLATSLLTSGLSGGARTALAIGLPVVVGGVALLIQFLVDLDRRLDMVASRFEADARDTRETVRRELHAINDATELFGLVEASALGLDSVTSLVRNATHIDPGTPGLISAFAESEVRRVTELLKVLGDGGDLTYDGEDRDWLLGLTKVARASLDATSLVVVDAVGDSSTSGGLWLTDLGYRYLEAQRDAIRRGVVIRRVFILDRSALLDDPALRRTVELQQSLGIRVRTLDPNALRATRRSSLFDFIVFDDAVSYEVTPASRVADDRERVEINTRLVLAPPRVKERQQRFEDLWAAAQDPPEPERLP
jgi:hypothetical protein